MGELAGGTFGIIFSERGLFPSMGLGTWEWMVNPPDYLRNPAITSYADLRARSIGDYRSIGRRPVIRHNPKP